MTPQMAQALLDAHAAAAAAPWQAAPLSVPPEPLFLITLPKTTSTIFSAMLGQHPMVVSVPELNLFVGATVQDWADQPANRIFCDGLLRTVAQLEFGMQTEATVPGALAWLEARASWPVNGLFDHLRQQVAPAMLMDQSPLYSQMPGHLARILAAYPGARFIRLVRNPVGWTQSMARWGATGEMLLRMYPEGPRSAGQPLDPLAVWHGVNSRLDAALAHLPETHRITIRGEDVMTDPKAVMARMLDWLGLPRDEAVLGRMLHPEESVFANWGPPGARGGNNPDFLSAPRLRVRDDRETLMQVDRNAMPIADDVLSLARSYGYV